MRVKLGHPGQRIFTDLLLKLLGVRGCSCIFDFEKKSTWELKLFR